MIVAEREVLPVVRHRTVVHMGCGDAFTVWEPIEKMKRIVQRATWRNKLIRLDGSVCYMINPHQITIMEGRSL